MLRICLPGLRPGDRRGFAAQVVPQKIFSGEGYLPFPEGTDLGRSKYFWR